MARVRIIARTGEAHVLECTPGLSLMENIRSHGLHELLALCGGNCSCGTCHVHVAADWFERLSTMGDDEKYLLEISAHRDPLSRLSCQLLVDPDMDGLEARIAAEDP